jgi:predicted RNase H-like HicB family nuclease
MSRRELADSTTFKVIFDAEPDGKAWNASIPSVQGCHSWGRSLHEARVNIREALSVSLDDEDREAIAAAAVFEEDVRLPQEARKAVAQLSRVRKEEAELKARQAKLVRVLNEAHGFSWRDTGDLIGMSAEGARKLAATARANEVKATGFSGPHPNKVKGAAFTGQFIRRGTSGERAPAMRAGKAKSRSGGRKSA